MLSKVEFTPTDEQLAIEQAAKGRQSVMIDAYAGVGKTTTLVRAASGIRTAGLALAFNKSVKEELQSRLSRSFTTQTLNGVGFGAMRRAMPGVDWTINDKKYGELVSEVGRAWKRKYVGDDWGTAKKLVRDAMHAGISVDAEGDWEELVELMDDDQRDLVEIAREALARGIEQTKSTGLIAFDDQIYYPTCVEGKFLQYPVVMVDEAQDLSPLNHEILARVSGVNGRLIVAGDRRQAIYQFRGAHSDSIGQIAQLRDQGSWAVLPLATTWRCPKMVVERQQTHAPGFRAADDAPDGHIADLRAATWTWHELETLVGSSTITVLCRNNGPLVGLAIKLLRMGIGCQIAGRDIGAGLIGLSQRLWPSDSTEKRVMWDELGKWAADREERVDRAECLGAVMGAEGVTNAGDLRALLQRIFSRDSGKVLLSTIHKAKGLEWPVVVHLDPQLIGKGGQERNLRYVAETRTRNWLVEVTSNGLVGNGEER